MRPDVAPSDTDAYLDMSKDAIAQLLVMLLVEEALKQRLAAFRQDPGAKQPNIATSLGVEAPPSRQDSVG